MADSAQASAIDLKHTPPSAIPTQEATQTVRTANEPDRILKERADKLTAEQKVNVINYAPASFDAYDPEISQAIAEKNWAKFRALVKARNDQHPDQLR